VLTQIRLFDKTNLILRKGTLVRASQFVAREYHTCIVTSRTSYNVNRLLIYVLYSFECCTKMAHRAPYLLGMVFTVLSFILCVIGFGTGSWWVTTDDGSVFSSAGLWQICFNGYEHTSDLIGKAYYGCWWIFYKEYYYIRDWIMPRKFEIFETPVLMPCIIFTN
jgi:hypothetical protein